MPAPLSNDIRKRIIESKEQGDSIVKIAVEKRVSESAVLRILMLYRETGSYEPRALNNGRKPGLTTKQMDAVEKKIIEQPDISLKELIEDLQLPVCESALCRIVNNKLGLQRKKKRYARQNRVVKTSGKSAKCGKPFKRRLAKLIFLDESSIHMGMTRLYGRALENQWVVDAVLDVRFHRTTILSSVRMDGTMLPCVFEDALNGELFRSYVRQFSVPTLKPGDIVVMDNLSSHTELD